MGSFLAVCVLFVVPAQASAASGNVAATHAYIEANYALARASVARIGPAEAKIQVFNRALARECPRIGIGSAENYATQPVSHLVAVALWSLAYGIDAGPIRTFIQTTSRLHWSNHKITRAAESYANTLHEFATLKLPDLCGEVSSWKANGFAAIPPATLSLVEHEESLELNPVSSSLLAPFEHGADARTVERTEALEIKLEENEFLVGQGDWIEVLETLGLNE
jgi:hypothetical protein